MDATVFQVVKSRVYNLDGGFPMFSPNIEPNYVKPLTCTFLLWAINIYLKIKELILEYKRTGLTLT